MIHSTMDTPVWQEEFNLLRDQNHFEKVWNHINENLPKYIDSYLEEISRTRPEWKPETNTSQYIKKMIDEHTKLGEKYSNILSPDLMEEYGEDVDGFKGSILSRQCLVIQRTLNSKSEALKDWKIAYRMAAAQKLYDTFANIINFGEDYNENMTEDVIKDLDTIEADGLQEMEEESCYLNKVIGTGIVSTILNAIYPRVFPGHFKLGMFCLYILSGKQSIGMRSGSSEFVMVKDDSHSKTGTIETEHNFFFYYETFALYALRIYRCLDAAITLRFPSVKFPDEYRYCLTNDFFEYIAEVHREDIRTLLGNDDQDKFLHAV